MRQQYQAYDVTTNLVSSATDGTNHVIGAIVAQGWFNSRASLGDLSWQPYTNAAAGVGTNQILVQLKILRNDNSILDVVTDSTWKCNTNGPIQGASIVDGEVYDSTKQASISNWSTIAYTGESTYFTAPVTTASMIATQMVSQPNDSIQITDSLHPIDMWTNRTGFIYNTNFVRIFDMGQNMDGWCSLVLTNTTHTNGTVIHLRHAETLALAGSQKLMVRGANVDVSSLGEGAGVANAAQLDQFVVLSTNFAQQFTPHFTYHGFRYVEIDAPEDVVLTTNSLVGYVIRSAVPTVGAFSCSQQDVNQLMTNTSWTLKANLYGVETGCSQRNERFGWLGDSDVFSQTACFTLDLAALYTKCIRDIRDEQTSPWLRQHMDSSGTYFGQYMPNDPWAGLAVGDIAWQSGGVIKPWQMYQNYADTRIISEHYVSSSNFMRFLVRTYPAYFFTGASPFQGNGDWVNASTISGAPGTWPTAYADMEKTVIGNVHYANAADILAGMSQVLQAQALATGDAAATTYSNNYNYYSAIAANVRTNFTNTVNALVVYDSTTHTNIIKIGNGTQGDYSLALYFNMVPANQHSNCLYQMLKDANAGIQNYNHNYTIDPYCTNHLSTGIMATARTMLELGKDGSNTSAYNVLLNYRFPSWLYQVTSGGAIYSGIIGTNYGATTTWERWNGWVSGTDAGTGYSAAVNGNSFNHFWAGAVGEWIYYTIAGINRDDNSAGFKNVVIKPEPGGGISNCFAMFNSIHGPIYCSWNIAGSVYTLDVTNPANTTASVYLPTSNVGNITENGQVRGQPATNAAGIITYYTTNYPNFPDGTTVFEIGSGGYSFKATGVSF